MQPDDVARPSRRRGDFADVEIGGVGGEDRAGLGDAVEGATLKPGFESFVGLFPIPMRHGMTIGELAMLFNSEFDLGASLTVSPLEGWQRRAYADETGLPWVMPSPNMPTLDTALVYPGTVLFEGTLLSEGRGTTRPFELVGAPWIDAEAFAAALNALHLPGVHFRPAAFGSKSSRAPHAGHGNFRPAGGALVTVGGFSIGDGSDMGYW